MGILNDEKYQVSLPIDEYYHKYYYDMKKNQIGKGKHLDYTNTFYFVSDVQPPLLRSWELELVYPVRK